LTGGSPCTVHAPSLKGVYSPDLPNLEARGGFSTVDEWGHDPTDYYYAKNPAHETIRLGIERDKGISNMVSRQGSPRSDARSRLCDPTTTNIWSRDLTRSPWYAPLAADVESSRTLLEFLSDVRLTNVGRDGIEFLLRSLEAVGLAPSGIAHTAAELSAGADALVAVGRENLFMPMYLMIGKKLIV